MFKVTCLADPQRKAGNPQGLGLGNPQRTALIQRDLIMKYTHNQLICNKHILWIHEMKEWKILRILAQESPKSELRLQRYSEKNFEDLFAISRKWLRVYLEIFSKTRGLLGNLLLEYSDFELFFNRKFHGLDPWLVDQRRSRSSHHGRPWSSSELGLAPAPGHDGLPRGGEKKKGATGNLFWLVPRLGRWRGGGVEGASMLLVWRRRLPEDWRGERASFNRVMKEGWSSNFFPSVEVVGANHRGGARPVSGGGLRALLWCERRKKEVGWAKRPNGLAGCWANWAESQRKFLSKIKYDFWIYKGFENLYQKI
jgi:hypothetical protein